MYKVDFSKTAESQFLKLPKEYQERLLNVIDRIKIRPYHFVKRKEGTPYFILRFGDYRAILNINDKDSKIFVLETGHRKNIYD